jgi:uncharacterized protein
MPVLKKELDFLTRLRVRELILMGLIALTALLANLPDEYVKARLGVDPEMLLAVLAIVVILGLFLYLKFFFFLAVVLLIAGANVPEQIAEGLNVSKVPIILSLVVLVGVGLVNYVTKLMPTGLERKARQKSLGASRDLPLDLFGDAVEEASDRRAEENLEGNGRLQVWLLSEVFVP